MISGRDITKHLAPVSATSAMLRERLPHRYRKRAVLALHRSLLKLGLLKRRSWDRFE